MADAELDKFKTDINLTEFAATMGYAVSRSETTGEYVTMRNPSYPDKIVVTRKPNGHYVFSSSVSPKGFGDDGTILDFLQTRTAMSFGHIRKELRPWIGAEATRRPRPAPELFVPTITRTEKDFVAIATKFKHMKPFVGHRYLEHERGLSREVLTGPRFTGTIFLDPGKYGNAIFPHYDAGGMVTGFASLNRKFKQFEKGGMKTLWQSVGRDTDRRLVIAEGYVNAISYHLLNPREDTRYAVTEGRLSKEDQFPFIQSVIAALPANMELIVATDADPGGRQIAEDLFTIAEHAKRADIMVTRHEPAVEGVDWNDQWLGKTGSSSSSGPSEKQEHAYQPRYGNTLR